jgi:hypothetical protein
MYSVSKKYVEVEETFELVFAKNGHPLRFLLLE